MSPSSDINLDERPVSTRTDPLRDNRARCLVTFLALCLVAIITHLPCADYCFINYDDHRILVDHPGLYAHDSMGSALKSIVLKNHPREEPLIVRDISWAIDSRIFGFGNPRGHHLVNVWLHGCVVGLLFVFMMLLTGRYAVALLTTICFLSLAVHVEPVAWVMGRKDLLSSCFVLLLLIAQCRMITAGSRRGAIACYAATIVLFPLALLSKISTVVVPGVLFLLGTLYPYVHGESAPGEALRLRRAGLWLASVVPHLVIGLLVCRWYHHSLAAYGLLNRGYDATLPRHMRNLLMINPLAFLCYLKNIFLPRNLSLFYSWPSVTTSFEWYHVALSAGIVTLIPCAAIVLFIRRKDLLFFYLTFLVLMVPYLNIAYIGIWVANRYVYLSSFCLPAILCIAATQSYARSVKAIRIGLVACLVFFCLYNGLQKQKHLGVWRNDATIWSYEMGLPRPCPEPFENLATWYYREAARHPTGEQREAFFAKAAHTIARARREFCGPDGTEPPRMYQLLFVEALMEIAHQSPAEVQLAALMKVEGLRPDFESVLWELTAFFYKRAMAADDDATRDEYARSSLSFYARYVKAAHRDAHFAARDRAVRKEYGKDFPFLTDDLARLP